jgi:hypothetical protein
MSTHTNSKWREGERGIKERERKMPLQRGKMLYKSCQHMPNTLIAEGREKGELDAVKQARQTALRTEEGKERERRERTGESLDGPSNQEHHFC